MFSTFNLHKIIRVKMDDIYIYIYHAYTLSLLLACLQNKHRRGRLYFQEREDDVDINISDKTECIILGCIYQVISSINSKIYYLIIRNKVTTYLCIICRYTKDLRIPYLKNYCQGRDDKELCHSIQTMHLPTRLCTCMHFSYPCEVQASYFQFWSASDMTRVKLAQGLKEDGPLTHVHPLHCHTEATIRPLTRLHKKRPRNRPSDAPSRYRAVNLSFVLL